MQKKILLSIAAGALIGGVALGSTSVHAQTNGFSKDSPEFKNTVAERHARHGISAKATLLGITQEELTAKMESMTFAEILDEMGISIEDYQTQREIAARARWEDRGISDEEINSRLSQLEERRGSCTRDEEGSNQFQGSPFGKGRSR